MDRRDCDLRRPPPFDRYHCVTPDRLVTAGLGAPLLDTAAIETLRRDRLVVVDDVLPRELIDRARDELAALDAAGGLRTEAHAPCNPGECSLDLMLWESGSVRRAEASHPALLTCVRQLWNLPSVLGPALGLQLRVPQNVLLASYPPGAFYRRHMDSYDGKDIPRMLTVLLYFGWEPQRGGALRAYLGPGAGTPRDIEPVPGRLTVFYAQEVEHEVLPSEGQRYALTLWVWDVKKDQAGR